MSSKNHHEQEVQSHSKPPHAVEFSCTPVARLFNKNAVQYCFGFWTLVSVIQVCLLRLGPTVVWILHIPKPSKPTWLKRSETSARLTQQLSGWQATYLPLRRQAGRLERVHHITLRYITLHYTTTYIHTYIHACMHTYIHTCVDIHAYLHWHTYMHTYLPTNIHT